MERNEYDFPPPYNISRYTDRDTISFKNKSFATLDPFVNFNVKLSKHLGMNWQFSYSISSSFDITYDSYHRMQRYRDSPEELTVSKKTLTLPFYRRYLANIGLYFLF